MHRDERENKQADQDCGPDHVRHAEVGQLGEVATGHGAAKGQRPCDHLAAGENTLEVAAEPACCQRVDKPSLGRTGEESESQSKERGNDRPPHEC